EAADGRDVVGGAKLALADAHGKVGALGVRARYLDDTGGRGTRARWSPSVVAANARRATEDSTAIAYIGDFDSGATRSSLPVTNEARMLQVSPASGAVDLVQPYLDAGNQLPSLQRTGERTFGRVIPSDEVQAQAGAVWAKRLGFTHASVSRCSSGYSAIIRSAFIEEARTLGISIGDRGLYYLDAAPGAKCTPLANARQPVIATDALFDTAARSVPRSATRRLITSAAEDPSQLPP